MPYCWDEDKRQRNVVKHGLDFVEAVEVLEHPLRLTVESIRNGESRWQAFAYVLEVLAVLTVVYTDAQNPRIISFRPASRKERDAYHDWLKSDFDDSG